jgi:hypothetical protein
MRGRGGVHYAFVLAAVMVVAVVFVAVVDPAFVAGMPVHEIVRRTFGVVVFGVLWVVYHLGAVELRAYEEADGEWAERDLVLGFPGVKEEA